jgi:ferredoxin
MDTAPDDLELYRPLARRLNDLPNGFPPSPDGAELRLLARLFTPQEAALAAGLRLTLETPEQIAARLGMPLEGLKDRLRQMSRKGLIVAGRTDGGLGFGLMPFVVGIYEAQAGRVDEALARLFEDYYRQAFHQTLALQPPVHRVVPINEDVRVGMEVRPFESASEIVHHAQAWGVLDCICRTQKALIGEGCAHPVDVCMVLAPIAGVFDHHPVIRPLTEQQALDTLKRSAEAGLVHCVSNSQEGNAYICNCCTCSCGVLRGMAELGLANVVARSAFLSQVDADLCQACQTCLPACQFDALTLGDLVMTVSSRRCVGCGACVSVCPEAAMSLVRRPESEILPVPPSESDWRLARARSRHLDLSEVL